MNKRATYFFTLTCNIRTLHSTKTAFNTGTSTLPSRAQQQLTELGAKKNKNKKECTVTRRISFVTFTRFGFVWHYSVSFVVVRCFHCQVNGYVIHTSRLMLVMLSAFNITHITGVACSNYHVIYANRLSSFQPGTVILHQPHTWILWTSLKQRHTHREETESSHSTEYFVSDNHTCSVSCTQNIRRWTTGMQTLTSTTV